MAKASVIIVTHNHREYIGTCIGSIQRQKYPHEIIIVDGCSSDGTAELVKREFPNLKVIECSRNIGYGAGNNLGVEYAKGSLVVILNPDVVVESGWLRELVSPLENKDRLITTPKILTYDGSKINTCGNINHFTGLTFTMGFGESPKSRSEPACVSGVSGCCFAMRREDYFGFDSTFFLYNDDSDFSWKAHLKGFTILYVPSSIIRHDYALRVSPTKMYYLERNRYLMLRKYLREEDLLPILPSLLIAELLTFGYAIKRGRMWLICKINAVTDGLRARVDKVNGDKRKLNMSLSVSIPVDLLTDNNFERLLKILANKMFRLNFKIVKLKYL
ncbi:MAG: glycosyltransferase family 2 protein [Candidatus Bathyarchaeia archaeon]|jgi:GT2 family glycosyltransferase